MKRTVIITGANTGIGFACAKTIAASDEPWHVILACRNLEKARAAVGKIRAGCGQDNVEAMVLDLASLDSIRAFAQCFVEQDLSLHGLVCNAGLVTLKGMTFTRDGFETMFGVNHLGHFLLANLLVPHFCTPGRIVFVSSEVHDPRATRLGKLTPPYLLPAEQLARPERAQQKMGQMSRYATSKLCNILCAYELDRRLRRSGLSTADRPITVNAYTPGPVPTTQMTQQMPVIATALLNQKWFTRFMGSELQTEESAGTALARLVLDPALESISSRYFHVPDEKPSSQESYDQRKAEELWAESAHLVQMTAEEAFLH